MTNQLLLIESNETGVEVALLEVFIKKHPFKEVDVCWKTHNLVVFESAVESSNGSLSVW